MSVATTKNEQPIVARGRPKGRGRLTFSVVVSPAYQEWMKSLIQRTESDGPSDVVRKALKRYARSLEFSPPPKR